MSKKPWHPCDDCIIPVADGLKTVANKLHSNAHPTADDVQWLYRTHDIDFTVTWLKLCVSVDFANDFDNMLRKPLEQFHKLEHRACQILSGSENAAADVAYVRNAPSKLLEERYEYHRKRNESREDVSDPTVDELENGLSDTTLAFEAAEKYLRQVAAVLRAKLRGKEIERAEIPKDEWSFPAPLAEWQKRFALSDKTKVSDRTLRRWRDDEGFRMKKAEASGFWVVHKEEPRYIEWEKFDKSRTSLNK